MPVGRRVGSRPAFLHDHQKSMPFASAGIIGLEKDKLSLNKATCSGLPKHTHIPKIASDSNLFFEFVIFSYCIIALALQFINLYHTVFWLPQSHVTEVLNFHLINRHLSVVIVSICGRRFFWCLLVEAHLWLSHPNSYWRIFYYPVIFAFSVVLASLSWMFFQGLREIFFRYSWLHWLFLSYPLFVYLLLFGFDLYPAFHPDLLWPAKRHVYSYRGPLSGFGSSLRSSSSSVCPGSSTSTTASASNLRHACTTSCEHTREEVMLLRQDFNYRLMQVLFNSTQSIYYVCVVPVCFAQNTLYIHHLWVIQFTVLAWIGCFLYYCVHYLSPNYIDLLHRSAEHLGKWQKVERSSHLPLAPWSELEIWPKGAYVKHVKGHFRAEGLSNCAEPGNTFHLRFYLLFGSALRFSSILLIAVVSLIGYLFILLLTTSQWERLTVLASILTINYYVLFKISRDWIILRNSHNRGLVDVSSFYQTLDVTGGDSSIGGGGADQRAVRGFSPPNLSSAAATAGSSCLLDDNSTDTGSHRHHHHHRQNTAETAF